MRDHEDISTLERTGFSGRQRSGFVVSPANVTPSFGNIVIFSPFCSRMQNAVFPNPDGQRSRDDIFRTNSRPFAIPALANINAKVLSEALATTQIAAVGFGTDRLS